ncbi:cold shock domain-containing protein [Nocardia sp. NPDC049737]|uniref:cold-shock protein n=1 Tax=unclassified Nocardia TaxID=2637762 RepID=UPI00342448AB
MAEGAIKWFDRKRGFGFIVRPGEAYMFVHCSGLANPDTSLLTHGVWVTYDIVAGPKGPEAINVRPVPSNRYARPRAARYQPIRDRDSPAPAGYEPDPMTTDPSLQPRPHQETPRR